MRKKKPGTPGSSDKGMAQPKRLTIDVSEDLHRRMKVACAERGLVMADVVRELLERRFPK
jgi:hypothetical protein